MEVIAFEGCRPRPLASYLKALGMFRLIAEQLDPKARALWERDKFYLESQYGLQQILRFFVWEYKPTPILSPWNAGSGFYLKWDDRKQAFKNSNAVTALERIERSSAARFASYRRAIHNIREILRTVSEPIDCSFMSKSETNTYMIWKDRDRVVGISRKRKDFKEEIVVLLRARQDDSMLAWFDSAVVVTAMGSKFPPLLGSGGNSGNLEFSVTFMTNLLELFDFDTGDPKGHCADLLASALCDEPTCYLKELPIGQFYPGAAGGHNTSVGWESNACTNAWDYVLMLEGTLLLAAAVVKRMGTADPSRFSAPFTVECVAADYASAADADTKKIPGEIWLPLWPRPSSLRELKALFSEGRATVGKRIAATGVDFAQAVARLGVDRGISGFERYAFLERLGQSSLAVPLGRWQVKSLPQLRLLDDLQSWLERLRRRCRDKNVSGSLKAVLRVVDDAIMSLCKNPTAYLWRRLLVALGQAEQVIMLSPRNAEKVGPIPPLRPEWVEQADTHRAEFRLALALASIYDRQIGPLRVHLVPLDQREWSRIDPAGFGGPSLVWTTDSLIMSMHRVLQRRMLAARSYNIEKIPIEGSYWPCLDDIVAFIEGDVSDEEIVQLVPALCALQWRDSGKIRSLAYTGLRQGRVPRSAYSLLKLAHSTIPKMRSYEEAGQDMPIHPEIELRAFAGELPVACAMATGLLRSRGYHPLTDRFRESVRIARRIAAALLFPLHQENIRFLARQVLRFETSGNLEEE